MSETDVGTAAPVFFGFAGSSLALILANAGAAYGTAKAGVGISAMGVMNPEAVMKNIIPVVMAGGIGIYGLIVAVLLVNNVTVPNDSGVHLYKWSSGFKHLAAGLSVGISGIGAGYAIGLVGDIGVKAVGLQPRLFVALILIMIFAEALALYGLIVALILSSA
mmetsp:Transcript_17490/g.21105  ORF Transcript_17490/g.21105 Transcript_17490/m.21105 type:complete len:163 (+) Transcript_17490:497-985(+)